MTNREWLNTLSDEEYAKEWLKIEKMLHGDCGFHVESITYYLQQPHETTADEDFAEIGFEKATADTDEVCYQKMDHLSGYLVSIDKETTAYKTYGTVYFDDKNIDQIRTIADKKRVEMGWK